MSSPKKFVALYDLHVGWEKKWEKGELVTFPTFNKKSIDAAKAFIFDFAPDILLLGGDALNAGPISHWNKGKPILDAGLHLKKEFDTLDDLILKPFEKVKRKIWLTGNHERWIESHVEEHPGLAGMVEPQSYLKLKARNWEVYSQGEAASIGKLHFVHGDTVLRNGAGVNPARTLVNAYRRNIRAGHLHTYSAAIEMTSVDAKDWHSGIIVPSLSTRNPAFMKNNPNTFVNGFLYGYSWPSGEFSDAVVLINNGTFTVGGKVYRG